MYNTTNIALFGSLVPHFQYFHLLILFLFLLIDIPWEFPTLLAFALSSSMLHDASGRLQKTIFGHCMRARKEWSALSTKKIARNSGSPTK